jgi:hypothetical protein
VNIVKGLVLSLLSMLLFFTLGVFGLAFTFNRTLLDPEFVSMEIDRLDIVQLAAEIIAPQVPPEMDFINEALNQAIGDAEPKIKAEIRAAVHSSYDYLLGRSQDLAFTVSLTEVKSEIRDSLWQYIQTSPPPELSNVPPALLEEYFDQVYRQYTEEIPDIIDETQLSPEMLRELADIRQSISYYRSGFYVLIALMLLLTLAIILISRDLKSSTRSLGISFLVYGAFGFAMNLVWQRFAPQFLSLPDLPLYLQTWLIQVSQDVISPLRIFTIATMLVGTTLLVVSFIYRRGPAEE